MKKVLDGKIYNTEKAEKLYEWCNRKFVGDLEYCEEALYRTPKGAYFIFGRGGAMTKYAHQCGSNSTCGGAGIEVLTEVEAMSWLEEHDGSDALIKFFADKIEEA